MSVRTLAAAAVLLVLSSAAAAQGQGSIGLRAGGRAEPMPLSPDSLTAVVQLDQAQHCRYVTLYDNFKSSSQPERDSLQANLTRVRAARQRGDQAGAQQHRESVRKLRESLSGRQKALHDAVKELLTKDQWTNYEQWRADVQKKAAADRAAMLRRRQPPPPQP